MTERLRVIREMTTQNIITTSLDNEVKISRRLIQNGETVGDAIIVGYSVADIDAAISRLNTSKADLAAVAEELDILVARMIKVVQKASK